MDLQAPFDHVPRLLTLTMSSWRRFSFTTLRHFSFLDSFWFFNNRDRGQWPHLGGWRVVFRPRFMLVMILFWRKFNFYDVPGFFSILRLFFLVHEHMTQRSWSCVTVRPVRSIRPVQNGGSRDGLYLKFLNDSFFSILYFFILSTFWSVFTRKRHNLSSTVGCIHSC